MEIKVYNNVFDDKYKTFEYDTSKPLLEQLEEHIEKETYRETLVECYDPETGETFYAPMLDEEIENPSVMIVVDGKSVDKDYQPKEGELVSVVFLPASERAGNIAAGAIIGAGVGITLAGLLLMPFAGGMFASAAMAMAPQLFGLLGLSGAVIGGFAGNSYYNNHAGKINGTVDSGKQGTQSPDVRGAENSSIRGENFSFVIGKHLVAPRIIGDPVTEYSGPRGEDAYIRTLYQIGYAPLKLTEFKLGEFMLAYNRDHKIGDGTTVECGTYVAGRLKGFSRGNVPDSGDILDYWKNNDVELEIIQQPNQAGEWVTIDDEYQNNTVIDLEDRPQVSSSTMTAAGWTVESGKTYTLFPQSYPSSDGTRTVLVTPIKQDGTVLTPSQLEDIAEDCLIPSEPVVATVTFNVSYNPNPYTDPYVVSQMKLSLNAVISSSVELQVNSDNAWVSVLTLPSGAISSQLSDNPRWASNTCRIKIGSWTSSSFVVSGSGTETINTPETYYAPEHPEYLVATFNGSDSATKAAEYATGIVANLDAYYNGEHYDDGVNYGSIYTSTYDDQQINANLFYIADKELDDNAKVVYKGSEFPNKFRTNGVFFTAACPMEFTITLDFQNGLYDTYTKTEDNTTTTHYDAIPLYLCVQWRVYNSTNKSSDPTGGDYDDWNTINIGTMKTLNATVAAADKAKHKGNDFGNKTLEEIYGGFFGKQVSDFSSYAGEDGLSEIRISKTVTLTKAQCEAVLADTNKGRLIEVRVLRVSPNYMNMVSDDGLPEGESAHSYSDHVKVISILTKVFDEDKLKKEDTLTDIKPLSDEDYKKFCLVAIKAKADASGYISQQLKNLTCIAESFSPIWMPEFNRIAPSDIHTVTKYFGYYKNGQPVNRSSDDDVVEQEVNKAQYEAARREGLNWYAQDCGSNFATRMKGIVFDANASYTHNGNIAYKLTEAGAQYNNNLASSGFLLACFGPQNGPIGIGEDGVNIAAIGEWADKIVALKDGSTFDADTEYNGVQYHDGDEIPVRMEANAYIYAATKLEDLLQKLAFCGRAAWFVDENGKISVLMDGPVDYTKGVINAQNCISSSNAFSYEEPPAGLYISFSDENDGYQTNQFYCWSDGNSSRSYHGQVEPYSIEFVTNPYQIWSLGRYLLALREMNREVLTRKIGVEGATYNIGNVVLLQSEDLLIGDCSGRIQEVIEDEDYIYGFVCNSPYEYNAEQGEGTGCSTQGVTIMQPRYYGKSNAVTLPISMPRTQTVGDKTYTLAKGTTNVVLFKEGVPKGDNDPSPTQDAKYNFKTGDICMFGLRDYISAPYRITKIKPEKDGTFTQTLIPYDEGLYNAGAQIPSFQSFMPPPVVEEAPVSLSEVPTTLKEQNDLLQQVYDTVVVDDPTPPDQPSSISAVASRDFISLAWINTSDNVKHTIIELSKQNGDDGTWTQVAIIDSDNWRYNFNRNTDGYPEADLGTNKLSTWRFRFKNVSICDVESAFTTAQSVTYTNYGTWKPAQPSFASKIPSEGGITFNWNEATGQDGRTLYGTQKYTVTVKYEDTGHSISEITLGTLVTNNLTAVYNFDRDSSSDGYPEANATSDYKGLNKYKFTISVENESGGTPATSTAVTFSNDEISKYGTWIPAIVSPFELVTTAGKDGVEAKWNPVGGRNGKQLYGSVKYQVTRSYDNGQTEEERETIITNTTDCMFLWKRTGLHSDGYPEKSTTPSLPTGTQIVSNNTITILSKNAVTERYVGSTGIHVNEDSYLTWLPHALSGNYYPKWNISKRCATISFVAQNDVYGNLKYGFLVSRVATDNNQFYTPDLETDCYSDIDSYKLVTSTALEVDGMFKQNLPLLGQDMMSVQVDRYDVDTRGGTTDPEHKAIAREYYICDQDGEDAFDLKYGDEIDWDDITTTAQTYSWVLAGGTQTDYTTRYVTVKKIESPLPDATEYKYRIYVKNADSGAQSSNIEILVTPDANSVSDLVDKAITVNKLDDQCVTTEKIATGAITAEQIAVTNLLAKGATAGTMKAEGIMADGSGFWVGDNKTMRYDYKNPDTGTDETYLAQSGEFFVGNNPNHESDPTPKDEFIHFKPASGTSPSQFWIAIKNIIFQTLQTIVTGIFRVKNSKSDTDANAFLTVNPTASADGGTTALTLKVKGKVIAEGQVSGYNLSIGESSTNTLFTDKSSADTENKYLTMSKVSSGSGSQFFTVNPTSNRVGYAPERTVWTEQGFVVGDPYTAHTFAKMTSGGLNLTKASVLARLSYSTVTENNVANSVLTFDADNSSASSKIVTDVFEANESIYANNVYGGNVPYFGTVYSAGTYNSGYFLLAQLEGAASSGNHDVAMAGRVLKDSAGTIQISDFYIYARGNNATISTALFIHTGVKSKVPLVATYEVFSTNRFRIRLYGQITSNWQKFNTVVNYVSGGDVSTRVSNLNVTFPNTQSSAVTGTSIGETTTLVGNAETASAVKDSGNGTITTFAYSKTGLTGNPSWLAAWNGYELRAIAPAQISAGDCSGNSTTASKLKVDNTITKGASGLQFEQMSGATGNPTNDWYSHLIMNHGNTGGYYVDFAFCFHSNTFKIRRQVNGSLTDWVEMIHSGNIGSQSVNYANSSGSCSGNAATATTATTANKIRVAEPASKSNGDIWIQ